MNSIYGSIVGLTIFVTSSTCLAHVENPMGRFLVDWKNDHIQQAIAFLPIASTGMPKYPRVHEVGDKQCISANRVTLDVSDDFSYNIDEDVEIEFEFYLNESSGDIVLDYDKNGSLTSGHAIELPQSRFYKRWYRHKVTLDRARFSGRRINKFSTGDLALGPKDWWSDYEFTLCGVHIKRSNLSISPSSYGMLALSIPQDSDLKSGLKIAIYDDTGRMPLPNNNAFSISPFSEAWFSHSQSSAHVAWPVPNHHAFYIGNQYEARLPVGNYRLVAAKGLEYRFFSEYFSIVDSQQTNIDIDLTRWRNMALRKWFSGDVHIHLGVDNADDHQRISLQMEAEDINVANILSMGNLGAIHFQRKSNLGNLPLLSTNSSLVFGAEDPRTKRLGHVIQLNVAEPIRDVSTYYLYQEVFDGVHKKGGLAGYAHGGGAGIALDLPYGKVDFIEVLQRGQLNTTVWFDTLNFGFKVAPVAGSDYPYIYGDVPGSVRNYVQVDSQYSKDAWFEGLKAGRTFVTNGPLLEFSINGNGIGAEIDASFDDVIFVSGQAQINPDIGYLESLQLIRNGKVVQDIDVEIEKKNFHFDQALPTGDGGWFVVKAAGRRVSTGEYLVAITAPIYVYADKDVSFCDLEAIPGLVDKYKQQLAAVTLESADHIAEYEPWDVWPSRKSQWLRDKAVLNSRIIEAHKKYDLILKKAKESSCYKKYQSADI